MTTSAPTLVQIFASADAGMPLGQPARELVSVPLDRIVPCRWQPRGFFDAAELLELALDIEQHGLLTPPLVWRNEDLEYELIAGERRIRACYALCMWHVSNPEPHKLVPSLESFVAPLSVHSFGEWRDNIRLIVERHPAAPFSAVQCREIWGTTAQLHELALVDNLQRADLTALEEAHALHDLIAEYSYTQRDLARRLGKSQTWISQRLNLLDLAPAVAELVMSGELEASIARDVARVAPELQPDLVAHMKTHGMRQKSAANLVGNILELSEPDAWASDGGVYHTYNVVIRNALEGAAPADRQRAMLKLASDDSNGRLARPHDSYRYDRALVAVGAAVTPYPAISKAFAEAAPALGRTCETCQLNARRPQITEVQELSRAAGNRDQSQTISWPHCGMGETHTCPAHRTADERISLHVPYDSRLNLSPEEEALIVKQSDWYQTTADFDVWYAVASRKYRFEIATAEARQDQKDNGVARALAGYIAEQARVSTDHVYSQPCVNCVFHKRDAEDPAASCHHQQQPPELGWDQEVLAAVWQISGADAAAYNIGRCKLFRLREIGSLPELAGKVMISRSGILSLLYGLSQPTDYQGRTRSGPRWLDVHRSQAINPPPWGECETVLKKLIPLLTSGQLYALLVAWTDVLAPDAASDSQDVYDPHANREITFRRVGKFAVTTR